MSKDLKYRDGVLDFRYIFLDADPGSELKPLDPSGHIGAEAVR